MRARRPIGKDLVGASRLMPSMPGVLFISLCVLTASAAVPSARCQAAPDSLGQHFAAAQNSLRNGDQQQAALEYKAFLGEAIHRVANAKARMGDLTGAAQSFDEAVAFTGPDTGTRLDYASVLFDENRLADAQSEIQSVLDAEPHNVRARILAGRIFFEQKDYPAAKVQFEAAASDGAIDEVWRLLSITYLRMQKLDNARSLLQKAIANLGDSPANRVAVAMVYYYGDCPDQAIDELKKLIARDDRAPAAHYDLGLAYLARNEEAGYLRAIPEFELQLKIDPNDFPSHYMLGYIALKQRDFVKAERELLRASTLNPQDPGTQLLLGQLYSETRRDPQAEAFLRKLIAASSENSPDYLVIRAHYMLGRILQGSGRAEEGTAEIKKSEDLRRQLRLSSAEVAAGRNESPGSVSSRKIDDQARRPGAAAAGTKEKAQAQAFINNIGPAIAEGYYNLGGIAAHNNDAITASLYRKKATEWDPSLGRQNQ